MPSDNSLEDSATNNGIKVGSVSGNNNQFTQNINQSRVSSHPVTSDMQLKWNADDFAESVRNGNLPAIKEYLASKDGFDPNSRWNGQTFVLELPVF